MVNEIKILEEYISANFKSKAAFARVLDMTPQNLNHHIREAKKVENIFSTDFKMKLHFNDIHIFPKPGNPTNDFMTGVNEPTILYEKLLKSKDDQIALLNKRIEELEDKYKPPLELGKTGGRRN